MKNKILTGLFAFFLTAASTFLLSVHLKVAAEPILQISAAKYFWAFFLPYILIVLSFFLSYRLRVLEPALLGYYVSIMPAVLHYFKQYSRIQTDGMLFVVYISPGILIYVVMKALQENYDNLKAIKHAKSHK